MSDHSASPVTQTSRRLRALVLGAVLLPASLVQHAAAQSADTMVGATRDCPPLLSGLRFLSSAVAFGGSDNAVIDIPEIPGPPVLVPLPTCPTGYIDIGTRDRTLGRTVAAELVAAVNALTGRTDAAVAQDPSTCVVRLTVGGRTFSFCVVSVAQEVRSGVTRAQGAAGVTMDPATGTATIITPAGLHIRVMGCSPDFQAFLQVLSTVGVTGAQASPGQFLLSTGTPGLMFSVRLGFEVIGRGGPAGLAMNPDGTATITYPSGEQQQMFPVFADVASFLVTVSALPGVTAATANLDGAVNLTAGAQTIRVRPDFSVRAAPAGSRRIGFDDPAGPIFDLGDGRRQRFYFLP